MHMFRGKRAAIKPLLCTLRGEKKDESLHSSMSSSAIAQTEYRSISDEDVGYAYSAHCLRELHTLLTLKMQALLPAAGRQACAPQISQPLSPYAALMAWTCAASRSAWQIFTQTPL